MIVFRCLLAGLWLVLASYTGAVVASHGIDLLPVFFGAIGEWAWPGQFNLDFLCFLILSAFWTMWRHGFSVAGLLLGIFAFFGGAGFLMPYLLILSVQTRGHVPSMLLGRGRVGSEEGASAS